MNGQELKARRVQAGLSGAVVCARARIDRARLSHIENLHVTASQDEMTRLNTALTSLIEAKNKVLSYAGECDLPISAV
jgi:hypothetical protein